METANNHRTVILSNFLKTQNSWIAKLRQENETSAEMESAKHEFKSPDLVSCLVAALAPTPQKLLSKSEDLEVMKKALSSIVETMEEQILTEDEASALLEFLATKFVERRFENIIRHVFDVGSTHTYKFQGVKGTTK